MSERVRLHHCLRVYPFHYVFSEKFIYWYSEYVRVKEKKWKKWKKKWKRKSNKHMYTVSSFIECIYWSLRLLYWVSCLWKFVCELSKDSHIFVSISLRILCVTNKWHFPRDFESLSSPSLHTLVIWLFSMTWFEWISAHSFFFDLFVLLMISHSPCLHCSLFISIYIPCSIFSTHHSYTSHQQFDILHFFSFIIDIFILDFFLPH